MRPSRSRTRDRGFVIVHREFHHASSTRPRRSQCEIRWSENTCASAAGIGNPSGAEIPSGNNDPEWSATTRWFCIHQQQHPYRIRAAGSIVPMAGARAQRRSNREPLRAHPAEDMRNGGVSSNDNRLFQAACSCYIINTLGKGLQHAVPPVALHRSS